MSTITDCTRAIYAEKAANRRAKQRNLRNANRVIIEPSSADYCSHCKGWHVTPPKLEPMEKGAVGITPEQKAQMIARMDYLVNSRGLSQNLAAVELGINQATVSLWMRGRKKKGAADSVNGVITALAHYDAGHSLEEAAAKGGVSTGQLAERLRSRPINRMFVFR